MKYLYSFVVFLVGKLLVIPAIFDRKIDLFVKGRKETFPILSHAIKPGDKTIWMHCASLGEFEQGRPILEALSVSEPGYKLILSFYSPSGYEIRKDFKYAHAVVYLPLDLRSNAEKFVDVVPTKRSWKDSSPTIAKSLHTCVSEHVRNKSIGLKLLFYTFKILKDRGVSRVDTMIRIDNSNISSIKMNRKAGWKFSRTGDYIFGTIDLNKTLRF